MQAITWIDRITEETNPWFIANKKENESDLLQATLFYLKDATECLKQNLVAKGALSSSCAAECLARMGQSRYAHLLYSETARIYLKNAESVIATSVRESLWSLREAYEYFVLAEEWPEARQVHDSFLHLAIASRPQFRRPRNRRSATIRKRLQPETEEEKRQPLDISSEAVQSIEKFLQLRKSQSGFVSSPSSPPCGEDG